MTFRPGQPGGPGRPRRETERKYLKAAVGAVPLARWRKVVRRALEDAEAGCRHAREFLRKVLIGENPWDVAELLAELRERLDALDAPGSPQEEVLRNGHKRHPFT
jgi:hypothetical protein